MTKLINGIPNIKMETKLMLSQEIVLALLQASITGAGLVLAVYALIIPISTKILESRAKTLFESLEEFKEESKKIGTKISDDELEYLKELADKIMERRSFPTYLSSGILLSFLGYTVSTLFSMWWLLEWNKPTMDEWLPIIFGGSTLLFLAVGSLSIKDIYYVMKKEFDEIKTIIDSSRREISVVL